MLLKIKSDGTVLYSVPESINQGSNLVNSVQVIAPFSKTLTADIAFQLPQGTITEPLFMVPREFSSDNKLNLWTIDIDRTITQYSGTVYFTIRFYTASEDENPPILATVRSSFPVNKAVSPSLPLEPTTETYTNVLSHINDLYLTKVDRFDILDLPEGIDYTENGLKTSSALFTNATFTVSTTVYNGSLLVLANETTSDDITTRIQTEILFAEDIILRRMITIVDSVVTVGDWENYTIDIANLQRQIDLAKTYEMTFVDTIVDVFTYYRYQVIVSNVFKNLDLLKNPICVQVATEIPKNSYVLLNIKTEDGTELITAGGYAPYAGIYFLSSNTYVYAVENRIPVGTIFKFIYGTINFSKQVWEVGRQFYSLASGINNGLVTPTERTNAQNAVLTSTKGIANGVASLDSTGKVPTEQLPPISITEVFVVDSEAEMLDLTAQIGDIAVRTDLVKSFILKESPASILANWQELLSPSTGAVVSVNGETGIVTLGKADIELGNVDNTSDLDKPVSTATQTELDKKVNKNFTTENSTTDLQLDENGLLITSHSTDYAKQSQITIDPFGQISLIANDELDNKRQRNVSLAGGYVTILNKNSDTTEQTTLYINDNYSELQISDNDTPSIRDLKLSKTEFTIDGNEILDTSTGLTKAEQTLTSEEQSQVQTNIDVYSKTEVDNKVASVYKYKGSVATYEDLPIEDLSVGDVYNVIDTGDNYAWTGTVWDKLGGEVDLSNYLAKDNTTAFTPTGDYNPATKKYVDDNQLELGETSTTAYAGDKGKTAYDHSQLTSGNPHSVSKSDVGLGNVVNPNTYGNIEVSDNLDDIVYTGFYTCYGSATGAPSEDYSWFVVHLNSGVGTTYAKQIAFAYDGIQYERFKNTTWGAWKQRIQVISGFNIAVEDFQENLTYSRFPYRASVNITGITSADHCKVYFTMANINTALDTETTFQVSSYNGGIHIYATDLPTGTLTVEDIEVVRG